MFDNLLLHCFLFICYFLFFISKLLLALRSASLSARLYRLLRFSLAFSSQRISLSSRLDMAAMLEAGEEEESARQVTQDVASRQVIVVVGQDGLKRKCLGGWC